MPKDPALLPTSGRTRRSEDGKDWKWEWVQREELNSENKSEEEEETKDDGTEFSPLSWSTSPSSSFSHLPARQLEQNTEEMKERKIKFLQYLTAEHFDLEALRENSIFGLPEQVRPSVWPILLGYWPLESQKKKETLTTKRGEYHSLLEKYVNTEDYEIVRKQEEPDEYSTSKRDTVLLQILQDVPRTCPRGFTDLFQHPKIQKLLLNVVYIWALQHPTVKYFQGLCDICSPFIVVHLSGFIGGRICAVDTELVDELSDELLFNIEADTFWSLSMFLCSMKEHFVRENDMGIRKMVKQVEEIVKLTDYALFRHLKDSGLDFLFFAVRWMICLLTREMTLTQTIRFWDVYLAIGPNFRDFHICVCCALLTSFSSDIQEISDFSTLIQYLQNLCVHVRAWGEKEMGETIQKAFVIHNQCTLFFNSLAVVSLLLSLLLLHCSSFLLGVLKTKNDIPHEITTESL